jgi:hypothetical protein
VLLLLDEFELELLELFELELLDEFELELLELFELELLDEFELELFELFELELFELFELELLDDTAGAGAATPAAEAGAGAAEAAAAGVGGVVGDGVPAATTTLHHVVPFALAIPTPTHWNCGSSRFGRSSTDWIHAATTSAEVVYPTARFSPQDVHVKPVQLIRWSPSDPSEPTCESELARAMSSA